MNTQRQRTLSWAILVALILATGAVAWGQQQVNVTKVGGQSPVSAICDDPSKISSANINLTAATGNTEVVAISASTTIYLCGFVLIAGGADGTQIITGTGSACATGETDKATFNFSAAGEGVALHGGGSPILKTAAGGALCVERTNSVTLSGVFSYVQQ